MRATRTVIEINATKVGDPIDQDTLDELESAIENILDITDQLGEHVTITVDDEAVDV
jgi:hypothetical protein